ncbi:uncharacterized protein LOC118119117 [Hippoglossus stenolepis]|uniref:uncharacterized protein LOC118119117 n=1 Tax=Hippoglossus stenolepis TaxID=195615 RepID=UPI001FAED77B|nr:uncharacterized protein LOC118119117 [Hippoglossus stenolepis]
MEHSSETSGASICMEVVYLTGVSKSQNWCSDTCFSEGSACEAPTSPECFKKNASESVYTCEWSMSPTDGNVTFDLYFNKTKFKGIYQTWRTICGKALIQRREVYIWVEAHVGNSSCSSPRRSVVLKDIVKYDAPQNISLVKKQPQLNVGGSREASSFSRGLVSTRWTPRRIVGKNQVTVENLSQHSAHWVQIRQRSTQVKDPLWSHWSPVVIVPADISFDSLTCCPHLKTNNFTIYVSYSPVDISVIARNAAGCSPSATVHVPADPTADLKTCDKTVDNKSNKKTCKQWYELQDGGLKPERVITLESKKKQVREQERKSVALLQDYVGYLYFEHMCDVGKLRTVKTCLYYQKEGAPRREPQDITVFGQTHNSANLSWKAITSEDQRGFLTHYSLCSVKMGSRDEMRECHNISASLRKYSLENLTLGTKYNISLAVVTRAGAGPAARVTINTLQEKHVNVWLSLGLLIGFFFTSTMCTVVLKRIQNKIFPPVPTPVIPDFSPNQHGQEMLEGKEEVDELILLQLHPERKTVPQEAEETTTLRGEWDAGSDEDVENESEGDSRMSEGSGDESPGSTDQEQKSSRVKKLTDLEQVESEIAMLIYRNGLVFDLKTDSP